MNLRPIPDGYLRAKEAFEIAVFDSRMARRRNFDADFAEAREDFNATIDRWQQKNGEREGMMEALDEKRRTYEQRLIDFEFDRALDVYRRASTRSWSTNTSRAPRIRRSRSRCEEVRSPYEEAIQEAQRNYENKRQEYLRMVEEVREQLDKAPDEYRAEFRADFSELQ